MIRRWLMMAVMAAVVPASAMAQGSTPAVRVAEILEASGDVEISRGAGAPWTLVRTGQELVGTDAVRTYAGYAKIKFEAGILWVLKAASRMQLQAAVAGTSDTKTIRVRLDSGKAVATWAPDRAAAARAGEAATRAVIETPSGQASIFGTEWSLNVGDDGRTALVVLTGSVELSNALGAVVVGTNEAAEMRVGQPPTLLRIVTADDRVQWVADYAAQPLRYADASIGTARADFDLSVADAAAGRTTMAIERLARLEASGAAPPGVTLALADLLIAAGDLNGARTNLEKGRQQHPSDARFDALLSRVALFEGHTAESRALAMAATAKDSTTVDGWLALGESAQRDGDGPVAREAFQRATVVNPDDARGWYGLGRVETEYEAFVPARRWLNRAVSIDPTGAGYRGELGTLETLANHFDAARDTFTQALADRPGDYVAMTGRALLALKEGREAEALDLLLRATLIEPSYARAHVYLGVAYYRLQRTDNAIRALEKASQLDPKDPLPYLMVSAIQTDHYRPALAMAAGRTARDLMPNLKSLNQLASTQKGTANLGNSVAFFGMEQWSQSLAQESYSPFWAGSHLFLGDHYSNEFARTSEYYKGLLLDPTVFGGSPMFQTLLPRAGNYVSADTAAGEDTHEVRSIGATLSANGYLNRGVPIGYAASIKGASGNTGLPDESTHTPVSGSIAIGAMLSPRWSVFATGASAREREHYWQESADPREALDLRWSRSGRRFDAGANFRPSPDASAAIRVGAGATDLSMPTPGFLPVFNYRTRPGEVQARYTTLLTGRNQLSAGIELASEHEHLEADNGVGDRVLATREMQSAQIYGSLQFYLGPARLQGDLVVGRERVDLTAPGDEPVPGYNETILQPRVGVSVRIKSGVLRVAYQDRTRPWAASSTLGPVATAGIPIDDQFVQRGGDQRRGRAQLEWEWSPRTFTRIFAEHQRVKNRIELNLLESVTKLFGGGNEEQPDIAAALNDLRDIGRDASRLNVTAWNLIEGDPAALHGRISIVGGALNQVIAPQLSLASQLVWTESSGTSTIWGEEENSTAGQRLSLVPRHLFSVGMTWVSPLRIYFSSEAIYRSERFETTFHDVENSSPGNPSSLRDVRAPDWTARLAGSWESRSKRWAVEFLAADLLSTNVRSSYQIKLKVRR